MKTPMRHGVAVFLAITMCTSLLFVYSVSYNNNTTASSASKGASGEKVEPTRAARAPPALQGYSSIIEHKDSKVKDESKAHESA
ncbi:hypothetical protein cypCar_00018165 [Cyprinus carpio]|nr:hypothetical protein cypCar_00018165 [Cyprinus carpio]